MNIFVLDKDPKVAAQMHCDKHISKMVVESAQMLSTVHRVLDGLEEKRLSKSGKRMVKYWKHADSDLESVLYRPCHVNHPCTRWTRESSTNYKWHYNLFKELSKEYKYRYSKDHASWIKLKDILKVLPENIPHIKQTQFALAMNQQPQCIDRTDPVKSYREFYKTKQQTFNMVWTKRDVPAWF